MSLNYKPLIVWSFIFIVIMSPIAIYKFYSNSRTAFFSRQYVKKQIRIDSVEVEASTSNEGGTGSISYNLYNFPQHIKITLIDNNNTIGKYLGEENQALHAMDYMKAHNDTIWVWFNSRAEVKYAKEEETHFPVKEYIISLIINGLVIGIATYGIIWQIRDNKVKKQKQLNA